MRVGFAIPGDLATVSGGYAYDRKLLALSIDTTPRLAYLPLPRGFPTPSAEDLGAAERALAAQPGPLLIDGLAYGAFPETLARAVGPRSVALVHHPLALETGLAPEIAAALEASERAALARAAGVLCTSRHTAELLVARFGVDAARLEVAEPGVPRPPFAAADKNPPTILAIGSLTPRKNFTGLIAALAHLADLDWRARIVGPFADAAEADRVRAAIAVAGLEARVRLVGPVAEAGPELSAADLFVSAALYEGYGMAAAEAIAAGLPVVAVAGGAMAQTAAAGRLVAPDEDRAALAAALAAAMRPLLSDPAVRAAAAAQSRAAADGLPRWETTAATARAFLARIFRSEGEATSEDREA